MGQCVRMESAKYKKKKKSNLLFNIKLDVSVFRYVNSLIKDLVARNPSISYIDPYWDDEFMLVDDDLFDLSDVRFNSLFCAESFPPIVLQEAEDGSYFYENGRHRHALHVYHFLVHHKEPKLGSEFILEEWKAEGRESDRDLLLLTPVQSNYYFFDHYKLVLRTLHKNDFLRRDAPVLEFHDKLVKYTGKRREALIILNQYFNGKYAPESEFNPEILESVDALKNKFSSFFTGLGAIFDVIVRIGECRTSINERVDRVKSMCGVVSTTTTRVLKQYGLKLLRLLTSTYTFLRAESFDFIYMTSVVLDLVSLVEESGFQKESLDTILVAGVSAALPSCIVNVLKQMSLVTNKKILDDSTMLLDLLSMISTLVGKIMDYIPEKIKPFLSTVLSSFGISEFVCLQKAKQLLSSYKRDKKAILSSTFRTEVKSLFDQTNSIDVKRFFSKNKQLNDVYADFTRLHKGVISYEQASRVEPSCFVFEGPPGCRKSFTINKIISVLGLTHYAHTVKSSEDGKDWYDSYDNEEIFYMDDVGQMGKSQWRNLINWVSAVKLPLDCAEASLKDTKYFNSETILLTTNNFMNLSGFTSKDCVETPEALWRRGLVFDMTDVTSEGDTMSGTVVFTYFDISRHVFVQGFPKEFVQFCTDEEVILSHKCSVEDERAFLLWATTIIMGFNKMRKQQKTRNTLSEELVKELRNNNPFVDKYFDAEVRVIDFSDISGSLDEPEMSWREMFVSYLDYCLEVVKDLLSSLITMIWEKPWEAAAALALTTVVISLLYKVRNYKSEGSLISVVSKDERAELIDKFEALDINRVHTLVSKVSRSVFEATIYYKENGVEKSLDFHTLLSERSLVVPFHAILDRNFQISVFKNRKHNHLIVDHAIVDVVYTSKENDVAILRLNKGFPTPFPKLAHCFAPNLDRAVGLVFPEKIVKLDGILVRDPDEIVVYPMSEKLQNTLKDPVLYSELHFPGMCGVPLIGETGHIKGMHIAGHDKKGIGVSVVWGKKCLHEILSVLDELDNGLKLTNVVSDRVFDNCSGIKIETDLAASTPPNSNFVPSPLFNLFETTRQPANLRVYGPHTVKDIGKAARTPITFADPDALAFAEDALDMYFEDYTDLSEVQVVLGDETLARMNKKSSNGFFPLKTKEECFDYENGCFKDAFRVLYNEFLAKVKAGSVEPRDIAWFETLKDELRNVEKVEPRSFRVSPVTVQVLTKTCFGNLVKHLYKERWFNEIMIGINPAKDWEQLYASLDTSHSFAGDIKKYDKNMLCQVQHVVVRAMLKRYKGAFKEEAEKILFNLMHSLVVLNDDSWILTHSLPSGSWLTAVFNSLINRVYTLMWYYIELKKIGKRPNKLEFHKDVVDYVYGDDRVNCCKNKLLSSSLNAITMTSFFESIGMEMTDSTKHKINLPFQPLSEITFLKRSFVFHPILEKISCPLDLRTIFSSLSWIDKSKEDLELVMQDKINAFQREIFLHYDLFSTCVSKLENYCRSVAIPCKILPVRYLVELYASGDYLDTYKFELLK